MPAMYPGAVDVFYEESKTARAELDALLASYRANTTTVLTLATGAATIFGLGTNPKGGWYFAALAFYASAATLAVTLFWPINWRVNVGNDMGPALLGDTSQSLTAIKSKFDLGTAHQAAIEHNSKHIRGRWGVARRFAALIVATGLVVICAGVNELVAKEPSPMVSRVQIDGGE